MTALRQVSNNDLELNNSIIRLSTGLRINSAADDPAGLVISEGMRAQLNGIGQAMRNSQDAINMMKTAEGALDEAQRLLRDIRSLAVHAANSAVVDSDARQADQVQVRSTLESINRIARDTAFGKKRLLDGTAGALANITSVGLADSLYVGSSFNGQTIASGIVTISRSTAADRALVTLGKGFTSANTIVTGTGSIVVNGFAIASSGTDTIQSLVNKINEATGTTGVVAQLSGSGPVTVVLSSQEMGSQFSVNLVDPSNILHTSTTASDSGADGIYNVSVTTEAGLQTATFTGGRAAGDSGLKLTDNSGNIIVLSENGNASITATARELGRITDGSMRFQIGANVGQDSDFSMPVMFASRLGTSAVAGKTLADLDLTTEAGANEAMQIIDDAITQLAKSRGDLGSFQKNFLESTSRSLQVASENLAASESNVRDADMAAEITQMTKLQILSQSGMSVLAQANQRPQAVLNLLRNG